MATAPQLPPPSTDHSVEARLQMGDRFLIHSKEELEKGDRLQAGNKAYGAAVQYLKAIGLSRGWRHKSNRNIDAMGNIIPIEANDIRLGISLERIYSRGHVNYYENDRDDEEIERIVRYAEVVLPKLKAVALAPPGEFTIETMDERDDLRSLTGDRTLQIGDSSKVGFSKLHKEPDDGD